MAKYELKFIDAVDGRGFIKVSSVVGAEGFESGYINIEGTSSCNDKDFFISLDKSTAIKFAKTLRTEINKIVE